MQLYFYHYMAISVFIYIYYVSKLFQIVLIYLVRSKKELLYNIYSVYLLLIQKMIFSPNLQLYLHINKSLTIFHTI